MTEPTRPEDRWLAELRELPLPVVDARKSERLRLRAQRVLSEERALAKRPALRPFVRFFVDTLVPAAMVGSAGVYLVLLLRAAASLYR